MPVMRAAGNAWCGRQTSIPLTIRLHWMIMMPFDPKDHGVASHPRDTGAYIMWAGTRYAHLHGEAIDCLKVRATKDGNPSLYPMP
jgi:hypothetical protein